VRFEAAEHFETTTTEDDNDALDALKNNTFAGEMDLKTSYLDLFKHIYSH
jgi:purine nucleoside permease